MIRDHKEDSNKQINEVGKSIQDLDKNVITMEEKVNNEMEIMKKNQVEMLGTKNSINQIQTSVDTIISRQNQAKERISVI
jgi:predicted  nucleic acid-binding Zn-ribbon protein